MDEITAEMIERGRGADPRSLANRRRLSSEVRKTREKLTSTGTGHRAYDVELLRQFANNHKSAAPGIIIMALTIGGLACLYVPVPNAMIWLSLAVLSIALSFALSGHFNSIAMADCDTKLWRRIFVLAEGLTGMVWGLIIVMLIPSLDPNILTFALFVLLLVSAMTSMISATVPAAVYGGLLPVSLSVLGFMVMRRNFEALPVLALAAGAQLYFLVLAYRLYNSALDTLSFQAEKDALIGELEQAKSNSDEADAGRRRPAWPNRGFWRR